jgi:uncharacterized protein YecE (DUF72 family)
MTRVWLGTSGYSYTDWVGPFYPPGTRSGQMLSLYARSFPLVELNFTFYRVPAASTLARQAEQTPEGFQFVVKLPRLLSHDRDPSALEPFREAVLELRRRGRLLGLLCQLPQAVHLDDANRRWIERLGRGLRGLGLAVEFRHRSWAVPEVPAWLREQDITLVSVDVPDLPGLYPRGLVCSGSRAYVRFHSRNPSWYRSSRGRYDYRYTEEELAEWAHAVAQHSDQLDDVLFLFNNCYEGQAIDNARQLAGLLPRLCPACSLVEPTPASLETSGINPGHTPAQPRE